MKTLSTRLVLTAVALVALVAVLVSVATVLTMRSYLTHQLDDDVRATLRRAYGPRLAPPAYPLDPDRDGGRPGPPEREGQGVGTLTASLLSGYRSGEVSVEREGSRVRPVTLSTETLTVLDDVPDDGLPHDVELPDLGHYRVISEDGLVAGLPTGELRETQESLVRSAGLITLLAIAGAAAAGTVLVRRQMRPLREVADTANRVAELPLAEGEISLEVRVPGRLTDDRDEVGQVGSALNTLLEHVETSLQARHRSEQQVRQFVADASHELRTPLATIAGYTELARRRPAETETALGKVEAETGRMTALVEDLLLLARLDAGRPLAREPVDLSRLLAEAVNDARVVSPGHRWRLALPDEPVEVSGDEARLHQVVSNLLSNARRHTPEGTTVTVTAHPRGFEVHDDGPGFPPDLVDHAFERFARGDVSRHREGGVGLGLALVQAIVAAHRGTVSLVSEPGDTTLRIDL